jgi:hypothetical protein
LTRPSRCGPYILAEEKDLVALPEQLSYTDQFASSASGHGADDQKWFRAAGDLVRQPGFGRFEGQILFAGVETDERSPAQRDPVSDRPSQNRITRFESVENRPQRGRLIYFELHIVVDPRQRAQVKRKNNTDHGKF